MADCKLPLCPSCNQNTLLSTGAEHTLPIPKIEKSFIHDLIGHDETIYKIVECNGCNIFFLVKWFNGEVKKTFPSSSPEPVNEQNKEPVDRFSVPACEVLELCRVGMGNQDNSLKEQISLRQQQIYFLSQQQINIEYLEKATNLIRRVANDILLKNKDKPISPEDAGDTLILLALIISILHRQSR